MTAARAPFAVPAKSVRIPPVRSCTFWPQRRRCGDSPGAVAHLLVPAAKVCGSHDRSQRTVFRTVTLSREA